MQLYIFSIYDDTVFRRMKFCFLLFSCSVMSNSLWSHRLQHARLPCPSPSHGACSNSCPLSQWCHPTISSSNVPFSCLQSFAASVCAVLVVQSCLTLCDPIDCSLSGSSVYRDSPGKNTGVGRHALLSGLFQTQESNPGLLHCRQILYHLSHQAYRSCLFRVAKTKKPGGSLRSFLSCTKPWIRLWRLL